MEKMMNGLIEANRPGEGPTECPKCGGPLRTVITHPFTGEETEVRCICRCKAEEMRAEEERFRERERRNRLMFSRKAAFDGADRSGCTFDADDGQTPKIAEQMRNYAEHFDTFKEKGQGLILLGETGNGKTFYAACIANALLDKGYTVLMTGLPKLVDRMQRDAFTTDWLGRLNEYDLLILDDLGTERNSPFMAEKAYAVINGRYEAGKPVVVTTNLTSQQLFNPDSVEGGRLYGRLLEKCAGIRFEGNNRRKKSGVQAEMMAILNGS